MWGVADTWHAWGLRDQFDLFGPAHLGVIAVTVIALGLMCRVARDPSREFLTRKLDVLLAMVLLWSFPVKLLSRHFGDMPMVVPMLPLQLCDWAAIAGFCVLMFRSDRMAEIAYFWGLAGTLQGFLTPNIDVGFPHPAWFAFFQLHGGVVLVAFYLVLGHRWRPRKGAVMRVFVAANLYAVLAGCINLLSESYNFGFLREKPASGSLLDNLGPWPYYIISIQVVALIVFILLDMPFWRGRRRAAALSH